MKNGSIRRMASNTLAGVSLALVLICCACSPWYQAYDFKNKEQLLELDSIPKLINAMEDKNWFVRKSSSTTSFHNLF